MQAPAEFLDHLAGPLGGTKGKTFSDRHQRLAPEPTWGYGCWTSS